MGSRLQDGPLLGVSASSSTLTMSWRPREPSLLLRLTRLSQPLPHGAYSTWKSPSQHHLSPDQLMLLSLVPFKHHFSREAHLTSPSRRVSNPNVPVHGAHATPSLHVPPVRVYPYLGDYFTPFSPVSLPSPQRQGP